MLCRVLNLRISPKRSPNVCYKFHLFLFNDALSIRHSKLKLTETLFAYVRACPKLKPTINTLHADKDTK